MRPNRPHIDRPVRVLVAPHNFELGGSQINALELAETLAGDPRFEVEIFAPHGVLAERVRRSGIPLHLDALREWAPSPTRIRRIWQLVRDRDIDLVHAYEWMPTVDAAYAAAWARGVPVISTVLSMDYPYFLPPTVPLLLGTRALVERAQAEGRDAALLEPPVDTTLFRPDALGPTAIAAVRAECAAEPGDELIVVIGRLAHMLKLEGLLALIEAVGTLSATWPVRLAVVGDGPERPQVQAAADRANAASGRKVIHLLGSRVDPLPYYLAADIAVGMGGSALRALAVGTPLLVQGEHGFWAAADDESLPGFRAHGWFGVGDGSDSVERCRHELIRLLELTPHERAERGREGRELVEREYSLHAAAAVLAAHYLQRVQEGAPSRRERLTRTLGLSAELMKSSLAIRFPALKALARSVRGGGAAPEQPGDPVPAVSVVIPCHNYAQYLDEAIASALAQEGVAVDVTVVDDGSNDGSGAIADRWAHGDERVRVIHHPRNRGHIATFNDALDAATAPYVVKLDADDVLTPGSLARSARVLERHPRVQFVYGDVVHARGDVPEVLPRPRPSVQVFSGSVWLQRVARHRVRNPISQPEVMIRRAALAESGGHRAEVPGSSDLHLWFRLASRGDVAWIRGAVQGVYRVHDTSMRATIHSGLLADVRARRDALELFLAEADGGASGFAGFARTARRRLARDAVTNAFLDLEAGRDPRPLMAEARALDPRVPRTLSGMLLTDQVRGRASAPVAARLGRALRDIAARVRWHRHRRYGV